MLSSINGQLCLLILSLTIYLVHSQQDSITFCYRDPECYELNDLNFNDKLKKDLMNKLNTARTLRIHAMQLSEPNYLKLFSHPLPNLKRLIFQNHDADNIRGEHTLSNVLTPKIVEKIFTSNFFPQLQELDMSNTHLEFKHFLFLQNEQLQITSNLKHLILVSNFLQKRAFALLAKINFQGKLETLGLAENSLISSQSIESILKIIQSTSASKSQLRNLTLYGTSISSEHLIRLLDNIQTQKMVSLNLAYNALQHSKSFKIPFNNTIFEYLSKCNFSSLKSLTLALMDLDDQQLPYLKNLKLPSLEKLDLQGNFITDNYFKQWIIQKNMPKLSNLGISQNDITDHGIYLFVNQKFQNISSLILNNNRRLTSNYLLHLSKLNTSKLISLRLSQNAILEKDMRVFFRKPFEKLQRLVLTNVNDGFDFFEFLNWKSMKNLRVLDLQDTDFSQSLQLIRKNNITFPKLKIFKFGGLWLSVKSISEILKNLTAFGPNLQQVKFTASPLDPFTSYLNLSAIDPQAIPNGMYLCSDSLVVYKQIQSERLQIVKIDLGQSNFNFYTATFDYSFFGNYNKNDPFQTIFYYNVTQLEMVVEHMKLVADWQNVQFFQMGNIQDMIVFLRLFFFEHQEYVNTYYNEYYDFIKYRRDFPSTILFPYLYDLSYVPSQEGYMPNAPKFLYYMNKMKAPLLRQIQFGYQTDESYPVFLNKLLRTHKNIKNLLIIGNSIDCALFQYLTNGIRFPFLVGITLAKNQIEPLCLSNFLANHSIVKMLDVSANFLEKGLFEKVFIKNSLILTRLGLSYMQIGNYQFAKMAKMNLEFLQALSASTININSEGIKMLVGNNTAEKMFPKCKQIGLMNNFINEAGVGTLLATGMPFINFILLNNVNNPNLFNEMFSYPNSFDLILISDSNIYGIDPNLDKRSTRHVKNLYLQSPSLVLQDFKALSKMDFGKIMSIGLAIEGIYECEILKYILKIVQNTDLLALVITNQKNKYKRLDDKCLKPNDPSQNYMRHLNIFNIIWQSELAYIPNFYTYFYSSNQLVTGLILANSLIGDDDMIEIVDNCNLQHLYVGILENNLLTDKSVRKLFSLPLNQLKQLVLVDNDFTYKSLQPLQNKSLDEMVHMDLSMNPLGDEAIQILCQAKFPKLLLLTLNNVDLTIQGLKKLSKLQAPQLLQIRVANNLFDEYDMIEFFQTFQMDKFPLLTLIITNIQISESNLQRINSIIGKKNYPERFYFDYYGYRLKMDNKAQL